MKARLAAGRFTVWMSFLSTLVVLSFVISAFVLSEQSDLGRESRERLCKAAQSNRTAMRNVLALSRETALSRAETTDQAEQITDYYERVFRLVPPLDCEQLAAP